MNATPSLHQKEAKRCNFSNSTKCTKPILRPWKKRGFTLNVSDNLWPGSCSCRLWPLKSFQIHFLLEVTSLLGEESHYIRGEVSGSLPLVEIETKYNGSKPSRYSGKSNSAISWPCYQFWSSFPYLLKDTSKRLSSLWAAGLGCFEIRVPYFTMCFGFHSRLQKITLKKNSVDLWKTVLISLQFTASCNKHSDLAAKKLHFDIPCNGTKERWALGSLECPWHHKGPFWSFNAQAKKKKKDCPVQILGEPSLLSYCNFTQYGTFD